MVCDRDRNRYRPGGGRVVQCQIVGRNDSYRLAQSAAAAAFFTQSINHSLRRHHVAGWEPKSICQGRIFGKRLPAVQSNGKLKGLRYGSYRALILIPDVLRPVARGVDAGPGIRAQKMPVSGVVNSPRNIGRNNNERRDVAVLAKGRCRLVQYLAVLEQNACSGRTLD